MLREKKVIDTIYELFKNKTIIMISHNKNFYGCNSIIKIENNNIIKEKLRYEKNLLNNWWNGIFGKALAKANRKKLQKE